MSFVFFLNRSLLLRVLMVSQRMDYRGNRHKAAPSGVGREPGAGCGPPITNTLIGGFEFLVCSPSRSAPPPLPPPGFVMKVRRNLCDGPETCDAPETCDGPNVPFKVPF